MSSGELSTPTELLYRDIGERQRDWRADLLYWIANRLRNLDSVTSLVLDVADGNPSSHSLIRIDGCFVDSVSRICAEINNKLQKLLPDNKSPKLSPDNKLKKLVPNSKQQELFPYTVSF